MKKIIMLGVVCALSSFMVMAANGYSLTVKKSTPVVEQSSAGLVGKVSLSGKDLESLNNGYAVYDGEYLLFKDHAKAAKFIVAVRSIIDQPVADSDVDPNEQGPRVFRSSGVNLPMIEKVETIGGETVVAGKRKSVSLYRVKVGSGFAALAKERKLTKTASSTEQKRGINLTFD